MPSASIHKCNTCRKVFKRKCDLHRHEQTEHNPDVELILCPYPEGIRLDFSSSASSPVISWTRENPDYHRCPSSTKVGQETNLTTHMLKHVNYRWSCPVCNASYVERASFSRHEHKWSASIRAEQQVVQCTLLMHGDNWLHATQSLATGVWGVLGSTLGSAFSWLGGAREPAREEEVTPRNRQRDRARYRPYSARARSSAPSPSPSPLPPSPPFFHTPSPQTSSLETLSPQTLFHETQSPQSSLFDTPSSLQSCFDTPSPSQSFFDTPSSLQSFFDTLPLPPVPHSGLDLIPEEPVAPYTPPSSPPSSPPCDWESLIDPRLL